MSKCENCIKSDVCVHRANIKNDTYAYMGVAYDTENCPHYKDKSLFVELPCKVGDTVYIILDGENPLVLGVYVYQVGFGKDGFWVTLDLPLGMKQSGYTKIGKTVFLTKEEAERKLREVWE